MKVGDKVRDVANLGGTIKALKPGIVCRALVAWSNGYRSWVKTRWLRITD